MQLGVEDRVDDEIWELGYDLKNSVTILGMDLKNSGRSYDGNIEKVVEKVRNQVRFCTRF
jgi:hypothetical protein